MFILILILFFLSGFVGLLYEVVWTRIFGLIFGNTTLAISTVLSAFFLGLALGGWFLGKTADRHKNPLRLFAWLELGVGLSALLIMLLHQPLETFFAWLHPRLVNQVFVFYLIKFIVAFLVMLPATFFMGGTLPVISRLVLRQKNTYGRTIGMLYGVNTLGAVAGCLLTAFLLIKTQGISRTITGAISLDFLIAVVAFGGAYRCRDVIPAQSNSTEAPEKDLRLGTIIFAAMTLSGFIALSYEVLWSRILIFVLTTSTYAFAIMLVAFLFGLACGGFVGGRWADRYRSPRRLLGLVEIAIGLAALFALFMLIKLPALHDLIFTPSPNTTWWHWNAIRFFEAFLVMFICTFFLGATFPIAIKALGVNDRGIGKTVGRLYFYNTLGGVLGAFLTGFVFIAWLGTATTLMGMVVLNLMLGLVLLSKPEPRRYLLLSAAAGLLWIVAATLTPKDLFVNAYASTEKNYPLIDFREGLEGTVTVHASRSPMSPEKRIDVDGLNVAGSSFMLQTLQTLQGQVPFFIKTAATQVVQIGFGTGQTSHNALMHPVRDFDLVEISPDVMQLAAEQFRELHGNVMADARFHPMILDGKNHIKYTPSRYDVIMNDANYAVATSSASLFTRDHFDNGRRKLKPGGIFSTWMTTDLAPEDFKIVLKTFQSVFPHALLWMAPNCVNKQLVLIGSTAPLQLSLRNMSALFVHEDIRQALAAVNIQSVYDLMACLLLDEEGIAALAADADIATDDLPILEYSNRDIRARDWCAYQNLAMMMTLPPNWKKYLIDLPVPPEERERYERTLNYYYRASRQLFAGIHYFYQGQSSKAMEIILAGSRLIPESRLAAQFYQDMDQLTAELRIALQRKPADANSHLQFARHMISLNQFPEAIQQLHWLQGHKPDNAIVNYEYARCLMAQSKMDSARVFVTRALAAQNEFPGAWYLAAAVAQRQNQMNEALENYRRALQLDPRMHEAWAQMGHIYLQRGEIQNAVAALQKSLAIVAYQPNTAADLADGYLFAQDMTNAITWYQKAVAMGLHSGKVYHNLGNAFALKGQFDLAVPYYRRALETQDRNAEIYYNLGNALVRLQNFPEAITAYDTAIAIDPSQGDYFNNLGLVYSQQRRYRAALQVFSKGRLLPHHSEQLEKNYQETLSRINTDKP